MDESRISFVVYSVRTKGQYVQIGTRDVFHCEDDKALKQASQRDCGVFLHYLH